MGSWEHLSPGTRSLAWLMVVPQSGGQKRLQLRALGSGVLWDFLSGPLVDQPRRKVKVTELDLHGITDGDESRFKSQLCY